MTTTKNQIKNETISLAKSDDGKLDINYSTSLIPYKAAIIGAVAESVGVFSDLGIKIVGTIVKQIDDTKIEIQLMRDTGRAMTEIIAISDIGVLAQRARDYINKNIQDTDIREETEQAIRKTMQKHQKQILERQT